MATDNTIETLRVLQVGIEAARATKTLVMSVQPTATNTITLGGITYTFVASGADAEGEINVGADLAAAKVNLVAAINGTDGWNSPNPYAIASNFVSNNMLATARLPGPGGNAIVTTDTLATGGDGWSGTMTGGAHARGTAAAATARLAVEQMEWGADDENMYHPQVANGLLVEYTGPGTPVQHGARFTLPEQAAIWEQLALWFAMTIDGSPTLTGDADGPYTLEYVGDPTAHPSPLAATFQRRFDNGLGDTVDGRAAYCMLEQIGLAFAANEQLRLQNTQGFGRAFETAAITGGLTLPDFEVMVSALSKIYIDDDWASVGNTLVAEAVIGWNWLYRSGLFPRATAEGRTDLSFTKAQLNGRNRGFNTELTLLLDPVLYAAEVARAASPSTNEFACQIHVEGSDGRILEIDMMVQHEKPLPPIGADEGQDTVTFNLLSCTDGTNFIRVRLTLPELPDYLVA